jgi:glycosyltransferase involved in cell wall biosynthesis
MSRALPASAVMPAVPEAASRDVELTILMPCLNEAETIATCIDKAHGFLARSGVVGEILIADNGSSDGSVEYALARGARVIAVTERGYGAALRAGIAAARGRYVILGDADDSYDFSRLEPFLAKLREGSDVVMGNRFAGGIAPGAMPFLHRYLGNPVLSLIGRMFFRSGIRDFHCGLRGLRRDAILALDLRTSGMEFASEMVVRAALNGLAIAEVPTSLAVDGRSRPPHLRTWSDGWRHLRFLLMFSPRWLFLYPGLGLMALGVGSMAWLLPEPRMVGRITLDIHTLFYASLAVVVGFHSALFYLFARLYGMREGLVPPDERFLRMTGALTLEAGLVAGLILFLVGVGLAVVALSAWSQTAFGVLSPETAMRLVIPSGTCVLLAFQTAYGAFFLSVLGIRSRRPLPVNDQ